MATVDHELSRILNPVSAGDWQAGGELMLRLAKDELRRLAAHQMANERPGLTLLRTMFVEDGIGAPTGDHDELLGVHEVLDRLAEIEPRKAEVVKLRYFIGMTIEETAEVLGIASATARRDMIYAKAWLYRELTKESKA